MPHQASSRAVWPVVHFQLHALVQMNSVTRYTRACLRLFDRLCTLPTFAPTFVFPTILHSRHFDSRHFAFPTFCIPDILRSRHFDSRHFAFPTFCVPDILHSRHLHFIPYISESSTALDILCYEMSAKRRYCCRNRYCTALHAPSGLVSCCLTGRTGSASCLSLCKLWSRCHIRPRLVLSDRSYTFSFMPQVKSALYATSGLISLCLTGRTHSLSCPGPNNLCIICLLFD